MTGPLPVVSLGEVVRHRKEFIKVDDSSTYKRCRAQLHAQGIVERDTVPGITIKTKEQQVCRAGELLVAEIDAKVGGFGIVPKELDGAIVSSHYFLFAVDESRLNQRFLDFYVRTASFREQVSAQGSTNYAAIRPQQVLGYKVPLPHLGEQRRIAARIDELQMKIAHVRSLRRAASAELEIVSGAGFVDSENWPRATVDSLVGRANLKNGRSVRSSWESSLVSCLTLSSVRRGRIDLAHVKPVPMSLAEASPYRVHVGDVFVVRGNGSKDLVGRAGLVSREPDAAVIFPDLFIKVPLDNEISLPEFFVAAWNSNGIRRQVMGVAKTTSGIWKINQEHVAAIAVPAPLFSEQRRIVAYLDDLLVKVDTLKTLQEKTAAELDALMPSILDKAFRGEL